MSFSSAHFYTVTPGTCLKQHHLGGHEFEHLTIHDFLSLPKHVLSDFMGRIILFHWGLKSTDEQFLVPFIFISNVIKPRFLWPIIVISPWEISTTPSPLYIRSTSLKKPHSWWIQIPVFPVSSLGISHWQAVWLHHTSMSTYLKWAFITVLKFYSVSLITTLCVALSQGLFSLLCSLQTSHRRIIIPSTSAIL